MTAKAGKVLVFTDNSGHRRIRLVNGTIAVLPDADGSQCLWLFEVGKTAADVYPGVTEVEVNPSLSGIFNGREVRP